jgi:hypothetical protein
MTRSINHWIRSGHAPPASNVIAAAEIDPDNYLAGVNKNHMGVTGGGLRANGSQLPPVKDIEVRFPEKILRSVPTEVSDGSHRLLSP